MQFAFECSQKRSSTWKLENVKKTIEIRPERCFVKCDIYVGRESSFYLWNVSMILFFLVLGTQLVVAISPSLTADRVGINLTLLLTAVAFKFVMMNFVPPVGYLTILDKCKWYWR